MHQDKKIGSIAIAVAATEWKASRVFESGAHVASLVAMLMAHSHLKQQLEIDLAEASERAKRLARTAETDQLTKVENKSSFEAKCRQRLTQDWRPAAMLALDLDDFKKVNDVYGHQFGDTFLKVVAETLKTTFPKDSIVGRTGGDEFCVLVEIPEAGRHYLHSVIRHVRLALQRSIAMLGKHEIGGVSIGVGLFPNQATEFEKLLCLADCALYASKRTERNTTTKCSLA